MPGALGTRTASVASRSGVAAKRLVRAAPIQRSVISPLPNKRLASAAAKVKATDNSHIGVPQQWTAAQWAILGGAPGPKPSLKRKRSNDIHFEEMHRPSDSARSMSYGEFCECTGLSPEDSLTEDVMRSAASRASHVNLRQIYEFCKDMTPEKKIQSAQFVHSEIQKRLAQRIVEISELPFGLNDAPSVVEIREKYAKQFALFHDMKSPETASEEEEFTKVLAKHIETMHDVVAQIAKGVQEVEAKCPWLDLKNCSLLNEALDRLFLNRISTRTMSTQHVFLHRRVPFNYVGTIDSECSPSILAERAYDDARRLCWQNFGRSPMLDIDDADESAMAYIPAHLHHILFELIKNSLRATCNAHPTAVDKEMPSVKVTVTSRDHETVIRVSDKGNGIPVENLEKIFNYAHTTADKKPDIDELIHNHAAPPPMQGLGYGLPISRLYARYFGGDLKIVSTEGVGTDAYIVLPKVEAPERESHLPSPFEQSQCGTYDETLPNLYEECQPTLQRRPTVEDLFSLLPSIPSSAGSKPYARYA